MKRVHAVVAGWIFVLFWGFPVESAIRMVTYNVNSGVVREGFYDILLQIGVTAKNGISRPIDVLLLQEFTLLTTVNQIRDQLNVLYQGHPSVQYATGSLIGGSGTALIYNTKTVELLGQVELTVGGPRTVIRSRFRPVGYTSPKAEFYVYNCHLKAGDTTADRTTRGLQAANIRADADTLGDGVHVIFAGDFNLYTSAEQAWGAFTASGPAQAFDPINRVGSWSNNSFFLDVHTQNPGLNFVGGGIDDRFDFQLVTSVMKDGEGLSYIGLNAGDCPATGHSYHAFGNNGTHRWDNGNGRISTGTGAPAHILSYLETVTDHLPVVADYQIPAWMQASVESQIPRPGVLVLNSDHWVSVSVSNRAPVQHPLGADQLRYSICTIPGRGILWGALPSDWLSADVGTPVVSGSASYWESEDSFRVMGSGVVSGTQDSFQFVYRVQSSDFELVRRVAEITPSSADARAGLMIRNTLDANSTYVWASVDGLGQVRWQHRNAAGGSTTTALGGIQSFPVWLRLVRQGTSFSGFQSSDGQNWQPIYSTTIHSSQMQDPVYAGMVSAGGGELATAIFGLQPEPGICTLRQTGQATALAGPNFHNVPLDTSTIGMWGTGIRVVSDSGGVQEGTFEKTVLYRVVPQQDFDGDGMFTSADIHLLMAHLGSSEGLYDLNADGRVDGGDLDILLGEILGRVYGDWDLDGRVDWNDLITLSDNWLREDAEWEGGDSNGDGLVNLEDFARVSENWMRQ